MWVLSVAIIHNYTVAAGMYAINSYLELGAAVLILWYGGRMAMNNQDGRLCSVA